MKQDWNPELYLKFDKERTRPSVDLVSRIEFRNPKSIIDIGCGPGNSTQVLTRRWPGARVLGIDNSISMIEKATKDYPDQNWQVLDVGTEEIRGQYDIVFSNAAIQWIPDHNMLLKKFYRILAERGVLAVQVPLFWDMPIGKSIARITTNSRWRSATEEATGLFTIHQSSFYYDVLSELFSTIDIWKTTYIHILDGPLSILEMIKSTGLKPYLDRLANGSDKEDFTSMVRDDIIKDYPLQKNGRVLFPFERLFFIARK